MVDDFENRMLRWGTHNYRHFPWREAREPFHVLVAEKLLQQTAARSYVVDAYLEVLSRYPTPQALSEADIRELKAMIAPLGFVYRAEELKALARALMEVHAGVVPSKHAELLALPGVGEYIARAVRCFGFGQPIGIVDANVARLYNRLFALLPKVPANPARHRTFLSVADQTVSRLWPREFNFAILDLCSKVCKATKPDCKNCPFTSDCPSSSNDSHILPP